MMITDSATDTITRTRVCLLALLFFGLAAGMNGASAAEEPVASNSPPGQVLTADLEYSETDYSFMYARLPVAARSAPFRKEPSFGQGRVIRGHFNIGAEATNLLAFAWDHAGGKLYLDLNRNEDLTDDTTGVFQRRQQDSSRHYQLFTNVHLPFATPAGNRQLLVNLTFYDYSTRPYCSAALRSFWQGKLTLQGADWQVGIVENPLDKTGSLLATHLLLRPWEARDNPFDVSDGSLAAFSFSRNLFVHNRAYGLDYTSEPQGNNPRLKLQLTEQQPALGELKITGDFVQRLILESGPYLAVIDQPEAAVKVPVGRYHSLRVWLQHGDVEASGQFSSFGPRPADKRITIDEKNPAELAVGGPLKNSVSVSRHGKSLYLSYQLLGGGGEAYQLQGPRQQPEFAVYHANKKIASGKFEFG